MHNLPWQLGPDSRLHQWPYSNFQDSEMRLLNAETFTRADFNNESTVPDYAILSHTWGDDEVTFRDFAELSREQLVSKRAW